MGCIQFDMEFVKQTLDSRGYKFDSADLSRYEEGQLEILFDYLWDMASTEVEIWAQDNLEMED